MDVTSCSGLALLYVHLPLLISQLQQWVRSPTPEQQVRVNSTQTSPYVTAYLRGSFSRSYAGHGRLTLPAQERSEHVGSETVFRWIKSSKRKARGGNILAAEWLNAMRKY